MSLNKGNLGRATACQQKPGH